MNSIKTIRKGMELIIEGCKKNSIKNCYGCPFTILCDSIYKDGTHSFTTPDLWEKQGIWNKEN